MPPPIRYSERPPPAGLAAYVRNVWRFEASREILPGTFTLPPDPCLSLALASFGGSLALRIVGPHLRPVEVGIGPGAVVSGVRMHPEAAGLLLDLDPREWAGRLADATSHDASLAASVGTHADPESARDALLSALLTRAASAPEPDPLSRRAVREIEAARGEGTVAGLAAALGVSARTLQRRFSASTGLPPKPFARVRRFLLAAANVLREAPETWGRVAAEFGYADQAHFTRECAALTGLSPTAFAEKMDRIQHVDVEP